MNFKLLQNEDIAELKKNLFDNGLLKVVPTKNFELLTSNQLQLLGYLFSIYCFPTTELADWLKKNCDLSKAIEIGAGHGALARYLKIPATDLKVMEFPEVQTYYQVMGQPITNYPDDIIKLEAIEAINFYKPETVIGCWVTQKWDPDDPDRDGSIFGIEEEQILKMVKRYIMVGNRDVHSSKRILKFPHKEFSFPWLYSRAKNHLNNVIYVWEKE